MNSGMCGTVSHPSQVVDAIIIHPQDPSQHPLIHLRMVNQLVVMDEQAVACEPAVKCETHEACWHEADYLTRHCASYLIQC